MKKLALMVLVALIAASPAAAATKKKAKKAAAKPAPISTNEASARLVRDAFPSFLPTPLKIIYFSQPENKPKAR
jgi:hypothetical protein